MEDKELIDWLEEQNGSGLISDDAGRWAISDGGIQNVPDPDNPIDIVSSFFVEAADWRNSVREAIQVAIDKDDG